MKQVFSTMIYENPLPHLYPRNSTMPNVCQLPDGRLMAAHKMGIAFESVDGTTHLSESLDGGRTWSEPKKVFDKSNEQIPTSDCAKITVLPDGRWILLGYEFFRADPNLPLGNAKTGGVLDDRVFYSVSEDEGKTWSARTEIPTAWNGHTEASAPICVLQNGDLIAPIAGFPAWDGTKTAPDCGRLLRSCDGGKTWNDDTVCMVFPENRVICYEQRVCQLEDGTIMVVAWNEDVDGNRLHNHVTFSTDNGKTFSAPVDTGIQGQASGIMALDGNRVLTVHALRRDTDAPGIYACIADVSNQQWNPISFERIWAPKELMVKDTKMAEVFSFLKFGQPNVLRLKDGGVLLTFWFCEQGCYKTLAVKYAL